MSKKNGTLITGIMADRPGMAECPVTEAATIIRLHRILAEREEYGLHYKDLGKENPGNQRGIQLSAFDGTEAGRENHHAGASHGGNQPAEGHTG